jgi:hypothetical protein
MLAERSLSPGCLRACVRDGREGWPRRLRLASGYRSRSFPLTVDLFPAYDGGSAAGDDVCEDSAAPLLKDL